MRTVTPNRRLPPDADRFPADKAIIVSQEISIRATSETCFNVLTKWLEATVQWDPMIVKAVPISDIGLRLGSVTQLTLKLGNREIKSPAVVTLFKAGSKLAWVLTDHPKVKEYWRLEPNTEGTLVHATLGSEIHGSFLVRLCQNWFLRRKLAKELRWRLNRLRIEAEIDK